MTLTRDSSSWRALIVDDKVDNLKLATLVLESRKAKVKAISESQRVFEAIAEFQPNLILLDLAMPGLNGWEIQRQLRARPDLSSVPIIALTALSMEKDIQKGIEAGFDCYVTKPYRSELLIAQLTACIGQFIDGLS